MKQLTVLHINKYHFMKGGSEVVYFRTADILEKHGHHSIFFSMRYPENLPCKTIEYFVPHIDLDRDKGAVDQLKATGNVLYSFKAKQCLSKLLDRYSVDIAHIHNIHRQMSPSILHELRKRKIPVVMSLHEHHMVCPSFRMLNHGKPCEACSGRKYYKVIKQGCIEGSRLRGILACLEMYLHHHILDIYNNVDVFISSSFFLINKHREMGFKKEIVHLLYPLDFQKFNKFEFNNGHKKGGNAKIVYFGRLVPEKGLYTLIEAVKMLSDMDKELEVEIIGEGPIREELQKKVKAQGMNNVRFHGFIQDKLLFHKVNSALVTVIPSECYDTYPLSVMESFAMGTPVIGAAIGGIPELVRDNVTGLTFEPGNSEDLSCKIEYMIDNPDKAAEMGKNARMFAEQEFNAEKHYEKLIEIYRFAMAHVVDS